MTNSLHNIQFFITITIQGKLYLLMIKNKRAALPPFKLITYDALFYTAVGAHSVLM
jgi:hypothetical protein